MASIKHNIRSPIIHQKDFKSLKIDQQILQQYTSLSTRHKDLIVNDSNDNSLGSTTESKRHWNLNSPGRPKSALSCFATELLGLQTDKTQASKRIQAVVLQS